MLHFDAVTTAGQLLAAEWDWDSVYARLDALLQDDLPEQVGELLIAVIDRLEAPVRPSAHWIFDLFPHVPQVALEALADRGRLSRSLLGLGAVAPELLVPHAESLVASALLDELPIGVGAMVLGELPVDRLLELGSRGDYHPGVVDRARRELVDRWFVGELDADELERLDPLLSEYELLSVGADPEGSVVRVLGTSDAWVMRFPNETRCGGCSSPQARFARRWHPTWAPASGRTVGRLRFGGRGTALESGTSLTHLLTLDLRAVGFEVERHASVRFELPRWVPFDDQPSFVRHAPDGSPTSLIGASLAGLGTVRGEFVSTDVDLVEVGMPYRLPDWGAANHRDNMHRVGGRPAFIQGPAYPRCPDCGLRMPYIFQLGDGTPGASRAWSIDEGMVYVFFCDACGVSAFLHQCS